MEVVVTGIGAITPLGGTAAETWAAVLAGRSGVVTLPFDWVAENQLPVTIGGIAATEPAELLTPLEIKRNDRSAQFALIAAREAWADAGLETPTEVNPERLAVCISSSLGGIQTTLAAGETLRNRGARRLSPLTIPMLMPNSAAAAVELDLGAQAGAHAPTSACASGAEAIAYGAELIQTGRADIVVAGGTEAPLHPMVLAAFAAARALSTRNDSPTTASRPFAVDRDGFVMGEGAAVLILESAAHAAARGSRVYAHLVGSGITSDAYHVTAPEPSGRGQIAAMRLALAQAGALPNQVAHINPHATSTKLGDEVEAQAICTVLGAETDRVLVSATKSMTSHLLGAAGALEAMLTVLALHHRVAPPTINLDHLDATVQLAVTGTQPVPLPGTGPLLALSNSFGFGGHNVTLAFAI